jgi:hypothetical protein
METLLPRHLQRHIVRLALAHPFTARELARIISRSTASGFTGLLIFDGYSPAIVGAGCFDRQNLPRLSQVFRQAIAR